MQFARRIELPAHSELTSWQPVLVPSDLLRDPNENEIQEFSFRALLFESSDSGDQLIQDELGRLQLQGTAWLARAGPVAGVVDAPPRAKSSDYFHPITPSDFVSTSRVQKGLHRNLVLMEESFLPGGEESLDGYDQLVIADEKPFDNPTSIQAIRRWLYGGGRLWVLLDQVSPALLEALLGDDFKGQIVDRLSLTHYHIQPGPDSPPSDEKPQARDQPVDFIRMLIDGVTVDYTIDGWPAAYSQECGEGRLHVTTLGLDGWVRPRTERDNAPPTGQTWQTDYVPGDTLDQFTAKFFQSRPPPQLNPLVLEEQSREMIGYSIPSRGLVVGILSGFAVAMVIAGVWLLNIGEAQRLAVVGPILTMIASLALMGVGRLHRSMPSMTAVTQFVRPIEGTTDVRATGSAALFVSDSGKLQLSGDRGGWIMPEDTQRDGTTRRMVWSDIDHWQWENLEQPAGMQSASLYAAAEMTTPSHARASFERSGIVGTLSLPAGLSASDPVIVTPSGRMAVTIDQSGNFTSQSSDVLTGDSFFSDGLLTDEQTNRAEVLSSLFESSENPFVPNEPTLYFWTPPWDLGLNYSRDSLLTGSALVSLPLSLNPPSTETLVIPAPFLPYREVPSPDGEMPSGVYDYRKRQWQERSGPSTATLRFQVPPEIGPIRLREARITIKVIGPMGLLQVSGIQDGTLVPVKSWTDPAGEIYVQWDNPDLLELDDAQGFRVHLSMGDPGRPELTQATAGGGMNYFRIESLNLELQATTTPQLIE
ncbi:MAG: hypothetical protein KDA52_04525 [Planctomycetaceae bacterium]|nr:hypothetical protein [Planctomycetaceae bacterium]